MASPGDAALRSAATILAAAQPGDCSAGLRIAGVAGRQRGSGHAERDREREVPRRDDRAPGPRPRNFSSLRSPGGWSSSGGWACSRIAWRA